MKHTFALNETKTVTMYAVSRCLNYRQEKGRVQDLEIRFPMSIKLNRN